ncbi:MAG: hypothetical protein MUF02_03250 [Acidobacteria bacterium]|jgi:hypothetical protein|nr:hypothetical protein [Acidobacteriota bacterium]
MRKLLLFLLLANGILAAGEAPNFKARDILVLQDGFIALRIENTSAQDFALLPTLRERVFISLFVNGVKRAEYLAKAVDPAIFLKRSLIVLKTNFRAQQPLKIRMVVNGEGAFPEVDPRDNVLEKDLAPIT